MLTLVNNVDPPLEAAGDDIFECPLGPSPCRSKHLPYLGMRHLRISVLLPLLAQIAWCDPAANTPKSVLNYIITDQSTIATSPARIDAHDRWVWGAALGSMLVLTPNYNHRQSVGEHLAAGIERENSTFNGFFNGLTFLGDGAVLYGTSIVSYAASSWAHYEAGQRFSARWFEAIADTTIWVTGIKMLAGRNRPHRPNVQSKFAGPFGYFRDQGANSSFPSGHTALAFASATVISRESGNNPWVGVPAYLVASGVGFSRVYVERHWVTDVVIGAALGHSIGTLVENRRGHNVETAGRWQPMLLDDGAGLCWTRRF
jgi:membrane-associated phospholipid phosphatase